MEHKEKKCPTCQKPEKNTNLSRYVLIVVMTALIAVLLLKPCVNAKSSDHTKLSIPNPKDLEKYTEKETSFYGYESMYNMNVNVW